MPSVNNVAELLKKLPALVRPDDIVWFRGEASLKYKLLPSLYRPPCTPDREPGLIKRFRQDAYPYLEEVPQTEFEWLFLMQHYSVQTRLLDWSEHPLVALYFAVENDQHWNEDGRVWCLLPAKYNDAMHHLPATAGDIACFDVDPALVEFLPEKMGVVGARNLPPMAAIAPRRFRYISAQHGVFTIFHRNQDPLDKQAALTPLSILWFRQKRKRGFLRN